ncbi:cytochrome P450 4V2-like isoform X1 [Paramuricea clavata]|uniref:Cytochrome P450 4V2-like isoform X1 n=1 Tax=Paramuricea clavata TaxID=317549 RepID=A0A6S7GJW0_PARCT|nr:cytochrome P450 4V2-like isoform X1 [Paramuricea clavata]
MTRQQQLENFECEARRIVFQNEDPSKLTIKISRIRDLQKKKLCSLTFRCIKNDVGESFDKYFEIIDGEHGTRNNKMSIRLPEGHDTTASSLQWAVHMIGKYPDVQSQLQNEVDRFYESVGDNAVTADRLKELHYLECVIKETLRYIPSVPLIGREISEDCQFGPYFIPKGCGLSMILKPLHHDPGVWNEPETFNPNRFLTDNVTGRNPFAHVPFSAGPRNCVGQRFAMMEEKVVLSSIIRHFNIKSTQITENIRITADSILSSTDGILVELETRNVC